jgi:hypothetical protein
MQAVATTESNTKRGRGRPAGSRTVNRTAPLLTLPEKGLLRQSDFLGTVIRVSRTKWWQERKAGKAPEPNKDGLYQAGELHDYIDGRWVAIQK